MNLETTENKTLPPWWDKNNINVDDLKEKDLSDIIESAFQIIESNYKDYQIRPAQIQMSKNILMNLMNQSVYIVEAGTGIGKSFAYLVAVIAYVYLSGERGIITTETKNLQLQLYKKDLPALVSLLAPDLSFELALGSGNYFCNLRHTEVFQEGKFRDIITENDLENYNKYVQQVQSGKLQGHIYEVEKSFPDDLWRLVGRDPDGCPGNKCMYFSTCNYYKVKAQWNNSQILIANHHLFLYNLFNDKRTLPSYSAVIFDEAHGILQSGESILTHKYSSDTIRELNKKMDNKVKKSLPLEAYEEWSTKWRNLESAWNIFFNGWEVALSLSFDENNRKIILENGNIDTGQVLLLLEEICNDLSEYLSDEEDSNTLNSLNSIVKTLKKAMLFSVYYQKMNFEKLVYWGEKINGKFFLFVCNLSLGDELSPHLTEGQVWTSATLGYWAFDRRPQNKSELIRGGYFKDFANEAFGENNTSDLKMDFFDSPYNYKLQAAMYIPEKLVAPAWGASGGMQEHYERELLDEVIELIEISKGGALVLFTSNYLLNQSAEILRERLEYPIFSQLEIGADKALKMFRETPDSVLLGTNSFWQGIDVTGRNLRALIITKMMFTPPGDPVLQARSKILEKRNENPFMKISLPKSCMMLRQAFGRLIRSESDKGFVAILDSRILQKSYGKRMLVNLPEIPLIKSRVELVKIVKQNSLI
jgi:ATP-dependent DNA helicase DinG